MDSFYEAVNCNKAKATMRCRGDKCAMVHALAVQERSQAKDVGIQRGQAMTEKTGSVYGIGGGNSQSLQRRCPYVMKLS